MTEVLNLMRSGIFLPSGALIFTNFGWEPLITRGAVSIVNSPVSASKTKADGSEMPISEARRQSLGWVFAASMARDIALECTLAETRESAKGEHI
jgi:hypothetical protein